MTPHRFDATAVPLARTSACSPTGVAPLLAVVCLQAIIIRALLSVQKIMISDKHCFELYGCVSDVLPNAGVNLPSQGLTHPWVGVLSTDAGTICCSTTS